MRSCIVVTWDGRQNVCGLRTEKKSRDGQVTVVACAGPVSDGDFATRLRTVYSQLVSDEPDCILLGGMVEGEVCFDLKMPKIAENAIAAALTFELPCVLPHSLDAYRHTYRLVNRQQADAVGNHLRVSLIPATAWDRLISDINAAQINTDAIINPYMALDPLLTEHDIFWSGLDDEYVFKHCGKDGLRQMVAREATAPAAINPLELVGCNPEITLDEQWTPAVVLARYAFDGYLAADRKGRIALPVQLLPQRCVVWRKLAVALGIVTFILLLLLAGRNWYDARSRYAKIVEAETKVNALIVKQQRVIQKNLTLEKSIQKISETKAGNTEIPVILTNLTKKLPDKMWVTNFRSKDQAVDLTITAHEDNDNILTLLSENGVFVAKNLKKQRNPDGTSDLQLFLETSGNGASSGDVLK